MHAFLSVFSCKGRFFRICIAVPQGARDIQTPCGAFLAFLGKSKIERTLLDLSTASLNVSKLDYLHENPTILGSLAPAKPQNIVWVNS